MSYADQITSAMSEAKGLSASQMKRGAKIVNKNNPEWGEWRVLGPTKGVSGSWEIRGHRHGERILDKGELGFWKLVEDTDTDDTDDLNEVRQGSQDVIAALKRGGWVHVNVAGHTYEMAKNKMGTAVTIRKSKGGRFGKGKQYTSIEAAAAAINLGDQARSHIIRSGSY